MPRIRSIKPEMFSDEKLAPLPVITRFVFVGLIAMADDAGRLLDNLKIIDAFLFPETSETARRSLDELSSKGLIRRGTTASGQKIVEIVNWRKHQRIDRANLSRSLPEIAAETQALQPLADIRRGFDESSSNDRRSVGEAFDEASSTDREGEGEREKEKEQQQQPRARVRAHVPVQARAREETAAAAAAEPLTSDQQRSADALTLAVAANQAIAAKYGEQPSPIIASHGSSHDLAATLATAGIPPTFAAGVIREVVARSSFRRPPRSLAYFRRAIEEAWEALEAHEQARTAATRGPADAQASRGAAADGDAAGELPRTPEQIRRRAEWWERLCHERGWNGETSRTRQGVLYTLERLGEVRDRAQFLAEWQILRPVADADLYRDRSRADVVAAFADAFTRAIADASAPAGAATSESLTLVEMAS